MWLNSSFNFELREVLNSKKVAFKNWNFYAAPEVRLNENITQVSGFFSDLGTTKKWNKYITTSIEHRIGGKRNNQEYDLRKRWSYGLQLTVPLKKMKISSTSRYQSTVTYGADIDLKETWREKFSLEYAGFKNLEIQISHELFFKPITYEYSDWRSQLNFKFRINKSKSISVGYLVQKDLGDGDMDFVLLSGYKWEFNRKKKKSTKSN
jgi:hypothetical protein